MLDTRFRNQKDSIYDVWSAQSPIKRFDVQRFSVTYLNSIGLGPTRGSQNFKSKIIIRGGIKKTQKIMQEVGIEPTQITSIET